MSIATIKRRVARLERLALKKSQATTPDAALMDGILAKADGEALEPADWTNAPAQVVAHKERLLEWLRTRRHD